MQKPNDLGINLLNIFDPASYKEFQPGFFMNKPDMSGYYYVFKNTIKPKICLIVNDSGFKYPSPMAKIKDFVFIVFNVSSMDEFINDLTDKYFPNMMEIIDNFIEKRSSRNLPYGYYTDENGEVKVDLRQAAEVRKIYDMYIDVKSVRQIASALKTNFSDIREILHDNEQYAQMTPPIVPMYKLKEVAGLMAGNVRGGAVAKRDVKDEIADLRRRRKERMRAQQQN
jgi:hypothetical protein